MSDKVELLAPAGSYECFIAALKGGADAVYLGLDRFGARANAANFTADELKRAMDEAHIIGRKIYLTVNTLFKDEEIGQLYDFLHDPYVNGLDGVIVQDPGVMAVISRQFPHLPIHVSTQAAVTSGESADFLKDLGVTRIVPARELSLDEIRKMKDDTGLEIECFIHGSMCYSYSGKCLLSSFIGGRSGNRGRCAQPCRLAYDGKYVLSLKDMCTIDILPSLIDAGISSFKIEGRMKSRDYVYAITSIYRKYIDKYYEGGKYLADSKDKNILISVYTRSGNCDGYYNRHNGREMITYDSPSYSAGSDEHEINLNDIPEPKLGINAHCVIHKNENAILRIYNDEYDVTFTSSVVPEEAVKRPVCADDVAKQISRFGSTALKAKNVSVDIEDGLFIANGELNLIRRQATEAFYEHILSSRRREVSSPAVAKPDIYMAGSADGYDYGNPEVNVSILDAKQLEKAMSGDADGIIVPMSLALQTGLPGKDTLGDRKLYISLPYVVRSDGYTNSPDRIGEFIEKYGSGSDVDGYYISNLESLGILTKCGYKGSITADIHMYAYNTEAYDLYRRFGITKTTVPVELNRTELAARGIRGEELIIYGALPVMISANCIHNTLYGCDHKSYGHMMSITDRKDEKLFVHCNCSECTNVIYNSSTLSIADEQALFERLRPSSVRLAFTYESADTVSDIIRAYTGSKKPDGSTDIKLINRYTKGHLKRGVF